VSPHRRGTSAYDGPERRRRRRRAEDAPPLKHGPFTTWQWAVLGSYFVAIVLAISIYGLAHRADQNAERGNAAICVETAFLRNSAKTTRELADQEPSTPESIARRRSAEHLQQLVRQLEASVPSCRTALK